MCDWKNPARAWETILAVTATSALTIARALHMGPIFQQSDVAYYLQMARGDIHSEMQPFASRQLGPAVVRLLAWILHWPVERAFILQGVVSLLFILSVVYFLITRSGAPRWVLVAIAIVPFWPQLFIGLALPDLWYSALLAVFLLLVAQRRYLAAACMMFPLMVSRESTLLTVLCFLIAGWKPLRWPGRLLTLAAGCSGSLLVKHLTAQNPGNLEHLPSSLYMLAKVPWNFMLNILGVVPWSNVNTLECGVPAWQHSLQLGPVRAVGVCGVSSLMPLECLLALLTTFGLLPLLVVFVWRRRKKSGERSVLLQFCLLYGVISFLLAPVIGVWFSRLFGYSWPLFALALPLLFNELSTKPLKARAAATALLFLLLHLAECLLLSCLPNEAYPPALTGVALGLGLYLAGFAVLRWGWGPPQRSLNPAPPKHPGDAPA
jgi:hypothetical protein